VVGCGYLGSTHAACLSHWGFDVVALDLDPWKLDSLRSARAPFYEDMLDPLLEEGVAAGRLVFTSDVEDLRACRLVFVCVGTPQRQDSTAADLFQVESALASLATVLSPGSVVVGKSTVPVGTAAQLAVSLAAHGLHLAWNPEFLREGTAVADTLHPERIVLGSTSPAVDALLRQLYAEPLAEGSEWVSTDLATAEMIKVASNAFLASKVSFINAIADLCDRTGADVASVAHAMGLDSRIGKKFLAAGLGYGGGCFPKDVRALAHRAAELGADSLASMLHAVDAANLATRERALALLLAHLPPGPARLAVLGASFKPGSDDVRDSPARWLVTSVLAARPDIELAWHDPGFKPGAEVDGHLLEASPAAAVADADLVVVATEWAQYRSLDPAILLPRRRLVLDLRNCLPAERWVSAGWALRRLGRPSCG
jgi:UDPglucose 6-dehydrogenase